MRPVPPPLGRGRDASVRPRSHFTETTKEEGQMTTTTLTMLDRMEEVLAQLWFQLDHIGNSRLQEEIEQVSDAFPVREAAYPPAASSIRPTTCPSGCTPPTARVPRGGPGTC